MPPPGQRVALARDAAFSFIYPHLIDSWRRAGAEILSFSPLADEAPPDDADCCWLPGRLSGAARRDARRRTRFSTGLRRFARTRPVHGECGGYMVLGEGLEDAAGQRHAMTGLLGHATSFAHRKLHLGYRRARVLSGTSFADRGALLRGHEFHYATVTAAGRDEPFVEVVDSEGRATEHGGGRRGNVTGAFFHVIAADSQPFSPAR